MQFKKYTNINNEKDNFHKALPNVKKAYVTLRKFTPDLKIFYMDISAISVTLCNSGSDLVQLADVLKFNKELKSN